MFGTLTLPPTISLRNLDTRPYIFFENSFSLIREWSSLQCRRRFEASAPSKNVAHLFMFSDLLSALSTVSCSSAARGDGGGGRGKSATGQHSGSKYLSQRRNEPSVAVCGAIVQGGAAEHGCRHGGHGGSRTGTGYLGIPRLAVHRSGNPIRTHLYRPYIPEKHTYAPPSAARSRSPPLPCPKVRRLN